MNVKIMLSEPYEDAFRDLGIEATMELGPFERVSYEDGYWIGDGERVAEIFQETMGDMMSSILGHPLAGYTLVPRTFNSDEKDDPDYPGKPYQKVEIVAAESEPTEEDMRYVG